MVFSKEGTGYSADTAEEKMTKQSEELIEVIKALKYARARFDCFNLEVAEYRVKEGMSDYLHRLYKLMGNWDQRLQELITDAEIISATYSKLIGEDDKP